MSVLLLSRAVRSTWSAALASARAVSEKLARARLVREWRNRDAIHKLQSLSDRQLQDIGLSRAKIEDAVRGHAPRNAAPGGWMRSVLHPE